MTPESERIERLRRIAAEETAKFIDDGFGQVDWSSSPGIHPNSEEAFADHDEHGLNNIAHDRPLSLRRQLGELVEAAGSDSNLAEDLARAGVDVNRPHRFHAGNWTVEMVYRSGKWHCQSEKEDGEQKSFTVVVPDGDPSEAMLAAERHLRRLEGPALRSLSEQDLREIALHAAQDLPGAITTYLLRRLPKRVADDWSDSSDYAECMRQLANPRYAPVLWEALWCCWPAARPGYSDSEERRIFIEDYIGSRVPTANLFDSAWAACQATEKDSSRSSALFGRVQEADEAEEEPDFDSLSDDEIARLTGRALKEHARQAIAARRGTGVLL